MKQYIKHDPWKIIEEGFHATYNKISESLFSIGNGKGGQRANFEEEFSGETLQGSYVSGVYYPDKTRVGWWKNGYPEYFAKVLNAPSWIGIKPYINGTEAVDLAKAEVLDFYRELNMHEGFLYRKSTLEMPDGKQLTIESKRFMSIAQDEIAAIRYQLTPLNFSGTVSFIIDIDADVENEDSNYDEKFWVEISKKIDNTFTYIIAETKKTEFQVCTAFNYHVKGAQVNQILYQESEKYVAHSVTVDAVQGQTIEIEKYVAITSSFYHDKDKLESQTADVLAQAQKLGFDALLAEQANSWKAKWEESDITIEGDVSAQQGIRFNLFQLNQTYTGKDARLNIGPKGFTGEKYGGSTYWDTEAYCLPVYLSTAEQSVPRNLLIYRHNHLRRAIENAEKLGFTNGAALYPMVTMNGEECHNEWEITFEEIHRNGAIAFAIYNYVRYTGDTSYLGEYGLDVLIGISRFWAQRVHLSPQKNKYVMLGVTGPNEYENNINNNWYTNLMAQWTLKYTIEAINTVKEHQPGKWKQTTEKNKFKFSETQKWQDIIDRMYFPFDEEKQIYLQQDGFLDKEDITVKDLTAADRPLNQNWSWDRILRSPFIKQADVLQGIYFFEENYDTATIKRHFDYYEPKTVHESSLSSCIHSIIAARINDHERAYQFYLNAARLDLDDYNNDTEDGLHITSMGGTWLNIIEGFAGMRVHNGQLSFKPFVPEKWHSFAFNIRFRGHLLNLKIEKQQFTLHNQSTNSFEFILFDKKHKAEPNKSLTISLLGD